MIISRTPFRVSFAGGGTDLPAFYCEEPGAVISTAIARYMYVTVHPSFDHGVRVSYSKTELVNASDEVAHPIVRESLRAVGITSGIEITSIADVPAGTGLGSSSSFAVGLLNALWGYLRQPREPDELARGACGIEMVQLREPIGKQDQYIAAYGGLKHIQFFPGGGVRVNPVPCDNGRKSNLGEHLLLFYVGGKHNAGRILREQADDTPRKRPVLRRMRDIAGEMKKVLASREDLRTFGELLHEGWTLKRSLNAGISNPEIDDIYATARAAGALGGKLLGAGGAGFFLFFCEKKNQAKLRAALSPLREMPFAFDTEGSRIIYSK